jgi:hypothetical protein
LRDATHSDVNGGPASGLTRLRRPMRSEDVETTREDGGFQPSFTGRPEADR